MISSRYLMPVSVPSTTTRAVLPRDEIPPHTMTPYLRRQDAVELPTVMETFTNTTVHSRTTVAAVEMKPGFIREKNTCPVLLREVHVSSTSGETCYMMTLLENRTYGWTSWPYASFTQSITYRSGTNPPKTRNTSSCQSSSSESNKKMNHPDVRILTIRRYAWTS